MGKLAIYKYIAFMFLIVTLLVAGFTFIGLFGGYSMPYDGSDKAMIVFALPVLITANFLLALYWLVRRRWHWLAIPVITLLCCIPYIGTVYQLGFLHSGDDSAPGVKIATYNVAMFGRETSGFKAEDILAEMKRQSVDILCFQEYYDLSGDLKNSDRYTSYFPHVALGDNDMAIYSRYPIKEYGMLDVKTQYRNAVMWADINVGGKRIRVYNLHLETTGINSALRQMAKKGMQGLPQSGGGSFFSRTFYNNYTMGMVLRAKQAQQVAESVSTSKYPAIVCGDFNDVPYSYVYHTVKGDLVDGFKKAGSGWMYTFTGNKKFRIDYIFHDKAMQTESYYRLDLTHSDHYPVVCKVTL